MLMSAFCVNSVLRINSEMSLIYMVFLTHTISNYKKASELLDAEASSCKLLLLFD